MPELAGWNLKPNIEISMWCLPIGDLYKDLGVEVKDLSAEVKDLSAEVKDLSAEVKDLSTKTKDLSAKAKDLSWVSRPRTKDLKIGLWGHQGLEILPSRTLNIFKKMNLI